MKSWVVSLTFLGLGVLILSIAQPVAAHIEYWAYIVPTPGFTNDNSVREPINLVFWWEGDAAVVNHHFINDLDNGWYNCAGQGFNKYAFVEDNHFGGHSEKWELQNYQVCAGSYFGTRYHVRIFDGYYDPHTRRHWSIAAAHLEVFECGWFSCWHRVTSWDIAESYVSNDFADESFVASMQSWYLGNSGYFGDRDPQPYNNGYATAIELTS